MTLRDSDGEWLGYAEGGTTVADHVLYTAPRPFSVPAFADETSAAAAVERAMAVAGLGDDVHDLRPYAEAVWAGR